MRIILVLGDDYQLYNCDWERQICIYLSHNKVELRAPNLVRGSECQFQDPPQFRVSVAFAQTQLERNYIQFLAKIAKTNLYKSARN